MSWKVINEVIGMASIDQEFCQDLLAYPVEAIQGKGFPLTEREKEVLRGIHAVDIYEFSKCVLEKLAPNH